MTGDDDEFEEPVTIIQCYGGARLANLNWIAHRLYAKPNRRP
jgi:hypothetical protein